VAPIYPKAMPIILREDEWEIWLTAPVDRVLHLANSFG
jgi:putative SOS response-associated peptidase YedK